MLLEFHQEIFIRHHFDRSIQKWLLFFLRFESSFESHGFPRFFEKQSALRCENRILAIFDHFQNRHALNHFFGNKDFDCFSGKSSPIIDLLALSVSVSRVISFSASVIQSLTQGGSPSQRSHTIAVLLSGCIVIAPNSQAWTHNQPHAEHLVVSTVITPVSLFCVRARLGQTLTHLGFSHRRQATAV